MLTNEDFTYMTEVSLREELLRRYGHSWESTAGKDKSELVSIFQREQESASHAILVTGRVFVVTPCCNTVLSVPIADAALKPTYDCPSCGRLNIITNDPMPGYSEDFHVWINRRMPNWPVDGSNTGYVAMPYSAVNPYGSVDSETGDITYQGGTLRAGEDF